MDSSEFKIGSMVKCVSNFDSNLSKGNIKLTIDKLYEVLSIAVFTNGHKVITVLNDEDKFAKYSIKRFDFNREYILSELLD